MLITERAGRLRMVRDGVLDAQPLAGIPKVNAVRNAGLFDVALHPKFAENKLVYFTYSKRGENGQQAATLARGRLEGAALVEVKDLFSGKWTTLLGGSRIVFAPDGTIFMTTGAAVGNLAQDPNSDYGKVLHLRDDGTIPSDNPFGWPLWIQAGDLYSGASRSTGAHHPPGNGRGVFQRERPERRRRDQHDSARQELRLAADQLRACLRWPAFL
jgi:glucose/arabinose dehydrogenase